ncbi:hypothetical protein F7725_004780 [Dissostichus mawsoni]|uniref:HMG box domain-containing protein n=1 Tax=Dissostichus mawsoni TaxID=36200 RepID=A0A7J5XJR1_DISMA|nr:hypothetical protein F7725_004780 [Dissostichus mawsoni]
MDPDSALTVSDVVSHFGELSDSGPPDSVVVPGNAVVEGDDPSFASTFVNAPSQGLEHLSLGVINQSGGSALLGSSLGMFSSSSPVTIDVPLGDMSQGLLGSNQLTTIDQSELSAQLGLGLGGGSMLQHPRRPATIDWKGGDRGEDRVTGWSRPPAVRTQPCYMSFPLYQSVLVESPVSLAVSPGVISLDPSMSESPLSAPTSIISPAVGRKGGAGGKKGKKKKDPNEPQKPVSAYALFFKDTQAAIKGQNPNATFGEVSKIVASMWDSLGEEQKQVYKRKNEAAKKDYLKALAEYRSGQISQSPIEVMDTSSSPPSPPPTASLSAAAMATAASSLAARNTRSQHYNPEENTITNICTSNIILDLPQVTTRSRTGATKPPPPRAPTPPLPNPPTLHAQPPPPLQAKPRASAPPPLQIKVVPKQPIIVTSAGESPSFSGLTEEMGQIGDDLMTEGEEGEEVAEEGPAVENKDWDLEYCSNEDVFMAWCAIRGQNSTTEMESLGVVNQSEGNALLGSSLEMGRSTETFSQTLNPIGSQFSSSSAVNIDVPLGDVQLTTIDVSDLRSQLGIGLGVWNINPQPQSHQNPLPDTASPNNSLQNDDTDDCPTSLLVESPVSSTVSPGVFSLDPSFSDSPLSAPISSITSIVGRKGGAGRKKGKKKKKKDPNEPRKPVSAYTLFFKDSRATIKGQNPKATFGEVSKIVASMWDSLGEEQKQVYKRKNEAAKKDYLKALTEYRAGQISQTTKPQQYNPKENTITNICTSNIILDLPQVTTRSRTGAIKSQPPPFTTPLPNHPTITKIIIKQMKLPSGVVWMTAASPSQPPPHRIMKSNPLNLKVQQMMHVQAPPSLQAEPQVSSTILTPLQIKVVPTSKQPIFETSAGESPPLGLTVQVGKLAGEEVVEAEEESLTPIASCNICVRSGCTNPAVESKDWDYEYCSNECVATHCSDEFMAGAIRGKNSTTVT